MWQRSFLSSLHVGRLQSIFRGLVVWMEATNYCNQHDNDGAMVVLVKAHFVIISFCLVSSLSHVLLVEVCSGLDSMSTVRSIEEHRMHQHDTGVS
jgi:hypothetical protein